MAFSDEEEGETQLPGPRCVDAKVAGMWAEQGRRSRTCLDLG